MNECYDQFSNTIGPKRQQKANKMQDDQIKSVFKKKAYHCQGLDVAFSVGKMFHHLIESLPG